MGTNLIIFIVVYLIGFLTTASILTYNMIKNWALCTRNVIICFILTLLSWIGLFLVIAICIHDDIDNDDNQHNLSDWYDDF